MLKAVTAIRFDRVMGVGKTTPSLVACEDESRELVELVVKFAAGCEAGHGSLVREAVAAMMAADLDLPVPEPFIVKIDADFANTITGTDTRTRQAKAHAVASVGLNFGSKKLPPGFSVFPKSRSVSQPMLPTAAEILAFDILIANPDRTVENPNCQTNGREFAIFDHELAFRTKGIIGWKSPWETGAVTFPKGQPDRFRHVFMDELRGSNPSFSRMAGAFDVLTDTRLNEYRRALPEEWLGDGEDIDSILGYVRALRTNIEAALKNISDALI
jgi:hypothetical protein